MKSYILNLLYDIALVLLGILSLPWLLYQFLVHKKYRQGVAQRFGVGFPAVEKEDRFLVWIHAPSVGETKAVAVLADRIKKQLPNALLLVSSVTATGHQEAKRSITFADHHVYMPLDLCAIVAPIIRRIRPDLVILSETDYWYNFANCVKKEGGRLAVVNAKMSQTSFKRYCMVPALSKRLFGLFDLFCAQSQVHQERLIKVGVPSEKCVVTGNLKLDGELRLPSEEEVAQLKTVLGIRSGDRVITVGSTHDPEEQWLFDHCFKSLLANEQSLKVILVPRHPERFNAVAALLEKQGVNYMRYTHAVKQGTPCSAPVILLDAMGLLTRCYSLSDLAIVGGSYVTHIGGHNILEPCIYGVPTLFGPHMHGQKELVDLVHSYAAGKQLSLDELRVEITHLLHNEEARKALGAGGMRLMEEARGATARTMAALTHARLMPSSEGT